MNAAMRVGCITEERVVRDLEMVLYRDTDGEVLAALNCDCLGCLQEARNSGAITEQDYLDIIRAIDDEAKMATAPCPSCGDAAYISQYEPSVMHCSSCGTYSMREDVSGEWVPYARGIAEKCQETTR